MSTDDREQRCQLCGTLRAYLVPYYTSPNARPIYVCSNCRAKLREPRRSTTG